MTDTFPSPRDPSRVYEIQPPMVKTESVLPQGHCNRLVITSEGAHVWSPQELGVDALRLQPKLNTRTTRQIVDAANFRWALEEANG